MLPSLPIPMITALLLGYLLLRALLLRQAPVSILILIAVCCGQSAIIALHQHYGFSSLRWLQPVVAACIPPLAWLAFLTVSKRPLRLRWDILHSASLVLVLLCVTSVPDFLDALIPLIFFAYGVALLAVLAGGEDSIPRSNLGAGHWPLIIWRAIAGALILSALSDAVIGVLTLKGQPEWTPWIVAAGSSLTLLGLGALGLSDALKQPDDTSVAGDEETSPEQREAYAAILYRLDHFMADKQPYLDPELTLQRLSRKLGAPAKMLSASVNAQKGENISRYVNRFRIEHACALMKSGANVTEAMLASGFNTKSNFNREFLRVMRKNPTEWKDSGRS